MTRLRPWALLRRSIVIACVVVAAGTAAAWWRATSYGSFKIAMVGDPQVRESEYFVGLFGSKSKILLSVARRMPAPTASSGFPQSFWEHPRPEHHEPFNKTLLGASLKEKRWPGGRSVVARVPCWILIALSAGFLPIVLLVPRRLLARKRRRLGLCMACGYNLTGNLSGTCPECGCAVNDGKTNPT